MRFELILEPGAPLPAAPPFLKQSAVTGRRLMGRLAESDVGQVIQWAHGIKDRGLAEEYYIGPITLEDVYLKMVGHESPAEDNGKEANDDTAAA
jgi:hypothetical protein